LQLNAPVPWAVSVSAEDEAGFRIAENDGRIAERDRDVIGRAAHLHCAESGKTTGLPVSNAASIAARSVVTPSPLAPKERTFAEAEFTAPMLTP
jgi:hypothetical protein